MHARHTRRRWVVSPPTEPLGFIVHGSVDHLLRRRHRPVRRHGGAARAHRPRPAAHRDLGRAPARGPAPEPAQRGPRAQPAAARASPCRSTGARSTCRARPTPASRRPTPGSSARRRRPEQFASSPPKRARRRGAAARARESRCQLEPAAAGHRDQVTAAAGAGRRSAGAVVAALVRHVTADDLPKIAASLTYFLTLLVRAGADRRARGARPGGRVAGSIVRLLDSVAGSPALVRAVRRSPRCRACCRSHYGLLARWSGPRPRPVDGLELRDAFLWAASTVTGAPVARGFVRGLLRSPGPRPRAPWLSAGRGERRGPGRPRGRLARQAARPGRRGGARLVVLRLRLLLVAVGVAWFAILFRAAPAPRRPRLPQTLTGAGWPSPSCWWPRWPSAST